MILRSVSLTRSSPLEAANAEKRLLVARLALEKGSGEFGYGLLCGSDLYPRAIPSFVSPRQRGSRLGLGLSCSLDFIGLNLEVVVIDVALLVHEKLLWRWNEVSRKTNTCVLNGLTAYLSP
jgi:hypothetical protein